MKRQNRIGSTSTQSTNISPTVKLNISLKFQIIFLTIWNRNNKDKKRKWEAEQE